MHNVNLDLLRAANRPDDPHGHHREEHLADLRAARRRRWLDRLARLRALIPRRPAPAPQACPEQPS